MNAFERFILKEHMPRLNAKKIWDKAVAGEISLNAAGWYDLTVYVTGDEYLAEKYRNKYIMDKLTRSEQPE